MKLKKGDEIIVTIGKDKGKRGKVDRILPKIESVMVQGINLYKRHVKRRDEKNPGGIIDFPRPLAVAKVVLVCPKCRKPTRVGFEVSKSGKQRVCKKCKQVI